MLHKRLIFGALMVAAAVGVIVLDGFLGQSSGGSGGGRLSVWSWSDWLRAGVISTAAMGLLVVLAAHEYCLLVRHGGHSPLYWPVVLGSVGLFALPIFSAFSQTGGALPGFALAVCVVLAWMFLVKGRSSSAEATITRLGVSLLGVCYLGVMGSFAVRLRVDVGPALLLGVLLTIKACDIGAYAAGRMFGRHKMVPWLSPGKTWEGLLGGVVLSCVVGGGLVPMSFGVLGLTVWGMGFGVVFGLVLGLVGQVGDLAESMLKRDVAAKDSGRAIPGFGGLLDILDSPLFAVPAAWGLLKLAGYAG